MSTAINIDPPDYQDLLAEEEGRAPTNTKSSKNYVQKDGGSGFSLFGGGGLLGGGSVSAGGSVAKAQVSIRLGFLRKVLGILAVQLVFTTFVAGVFVYTPGLKGLVQQWSWMVLLAFVLSIGLLIAMVAKRHETPTNYFILAAWTLVEAYTVGVLTSFFDQDVVVQAVFLTAGVVVSLAIYTLQTKRDFSSMGSALFSFLFVLIIGGFLQMFLMNETLNFVMALGGAVIFSLFIIYDLQNIMQRTDPEEYILATINLYLDIINLFIEILKILQYFKNQN